jgi:GT2 family glycosyltransferase
MFSIIVCSHRPKRAAFIREHYASLFRDRKHELILIEDAKSLCEGYSRGFDQARGDLLIYSHDDIEFITPDVAARLERHLTDFDLIGVAGTTKLIDGAWFSAGDPFCFLLVLYREETDLFSVRFAGKGPLCVPNIQALDGCFLACRREVVANVGFDQRAFDGFHLYDLDFTFTAYLRGFKLAVCRDLPLIHDSMGKPDHAWEFYRKRFESKHRGRFALGSPGDMKVVGARGTKNQLANVCSPENLLQAIRWS